MEETTTTAAFETTEPAAVSKKPRAKRKDSGIPRGPKVKPTDAPNLMAMTGDTLAQLTERELGIALQETTTVLGNLRLEITRRQEALASMTSAAKEVGA